MRLVGKVAIITGAASGIGLATAIRFSEEGAAVVVADVNEMGGEACVEQIVSRGGNAVYIKTDVSRDADLQAMIEFAVATYGGLDILHNNAYWTEPATALDTSADNWQRTMGVTLRPVLFSVKFAAHYLRMRRGVVLNTASVQSLIGISGFAAYQAAKGGMMALTRALAVELAPEIRVVAILPGSVDTPAARVAGDELVAEQMKILPLRRQARPIEIANAALFLASDEASYVTGIGLVVDGGMTAI